MLTRSVSEFVLNYFVKGKKDMRKAQFIGTFSVLIPGSVL